MKSDIAFDCNETILKQQEILKREIQDCLQMLSKVKIWIQVGSAVPDPLCARSTPPRLLAPHSQRCHQEQ